MSAIPINTVGSILHKSWYKTWWGILLLIVFFPFTISYLIWKQNFPIPVKLIAIAIFWIVFGVIGSSNNSNTGTNKQILSSIDIPTITLTPIPTSMPLPTLTTIPDFRDIPYELADTNELLNTKSQNMTIIISPNNVNETDLTELGKKLKYDGQNKQISFVLVFSSKEAAVDIRPLYQNEDSRLTKTQETLYEKSSIGQYIKTKDVHKFTFCLKGYYLDDCKGESNKRVINY